MIKMNIEETKQKLLDCLNQNVSVNIVDETITASQIMLTFDPINKLHIEIDEHGITVLYSGEHNQFWIDPYKNEDAFITDVVKFLTLLLLNTVLMEYVYSGNTLLSYKIWIIDKISNQKRILKKVTASLNPLVRLKPKSITTKEVCFNSSK
jgi:hypothetical protein